MKASPRRRGAQNDRPKGTKENTGFVLILTVALLTLLVALLLGFSTLTRIEATNAGYTLKQAQARQNALLALELALGQLQKQAGPDRRVTTTAHSFAAANRHYTGVWDGAAVGPTPLTWLISGNEGENALAVTPDAAGSDLVELAGKHTTGRPAEIVAPRQLLRAAGLPGQNTAVTIGSYAWWVGDQGVKAAVALPDRSTEITYEPYVSMELRERLRQQIALGAGPEEFEPRDALNLPLLPSLTDFNQLAFLKKSDATALGSTTIKANFQVWSPDNLAVLANSQIGGLRQDLSLQPELLGPAFAAWADYKTTMEDPADATKSPAPNPDLGTAESMRRRYRITPPVTDGGIVAGVAPVLGLCLLNFDSRTVNGAAGNAKIESRLRWIVGLWNPYSSALVPQDLRLEISGLPESVEFTPSSNGPTLARISLAALFGAPLRLALPWTHIRADLQGQPDASSWLPGRMYYWTSLANTNEPPAGNTGYFYSKSLIGSPSRVVSRIADVTLFGNTVGGWRVNSDTTLTARLYRGDEVEPLATFISPTFPPFFATDAVTTPRASSGTYEFSFFFRLDQNRIVGDSVWLTAARRDPRHPLLPADAFVGGSQGPLPAAYPGVPAITNDDLLLERAMANEGQSYNEDVPVFELPRAPILSVGELQHLQIIDERPFTVGHPSSQTGEWNGLFDRFFFSGLTRDVALPDLGAGQSLPNTMLSALPPRRDGTIVTAADLRAEATAERAAFSSRHLLARGAFNLNSVAPAAWRAVIRGTRYRLSDAFRYLDASELTGTNGDSSGKEISGPMPAVFFRFPHSAGEVFKAEPGKAGGLKGAFNPAPSEIANTHLFRRGMRILTDQEVAAFAEAIVLGLATRQRAEGPFRSTREFLDEGIFENAIAEAGLNEAVAEFSSQWLTPGDLMTALAPLLFPRSDTFLIRAYGDTVNPVTGTVEGRAWCEAVAQRVPEYLDPTQAEETPLASLNSINARFGRRFKLVSFRWLTAFDI